MAILSYKEVTHNFEMPASMCKSHAGKVYYKILTGDYVELNYFDCITRTSKGEIVISFDTGEELNEFGNIYFIKILDDGKFMYDSKAPWMDLESNLHFIIGADKDSVIDNNFKTFKASKLTEDYVMRKSVYDPKLFLSYVRTWNDFVLDSCCEYEPKKIKKLAKLFGL